MQRAVARMAQGPHRRWVARFHSCADLLDEHEDRVELQVCSPIFKSYGANDTFSGKISTVQVHNDNSLVKLALSEPGEGKVLVVDGGAALTRSLVGDMNAAAGTKNGWAGILVNGCIRDSHEISKIPIGIKALGTVPRKTDKNNIGKRDLPVAFANVRFYPGHYIYSDHDGIVVSPVPLELPAVDHDAPPAKL